MLKKLSIFIFLVAFIQCGANSTPSHIENNTPQFKNKEKNLPITVNESVIYILKDMSIEEKKNIKNTKEKELIRFHFGWGTGIRNELGLWGKNEALMKDTGTNHPDDASMVIIKAVWKKLQETTLK